MRKTLRQTYRDSRKLVTGADRSTAEHAVTQHLHAYIDKLNPTLLCAYLANDGEVDLRPLLEKSLYKSTISIGLPRVNGEQMSFHHWRPTDPLEANRWQILEPTQDSPLIDPGQIDMMLMPLVAFDASGNRLGMGGGYYDRYLANLPTETPRIGIAFSKQQSSEALPTEAWDMPMTAVVTEAGVIEFAPAT